MKQAYFYIFAFFLVFIGILIFAIVQYFENRVFPDAQIPAVVSPAIETTTPVPQERQLKTVTGSASAMVITDEYKKSTEQINANSEFYNRRSQLITELLLQLPYQGAFVSLDYNFDTAEFIAMIDASNRSAGTAELDEYLRAHNIESRSWIDNLIIQTE